MKKQLKTLRRLASQANVRLEETRGGASFRHDLEQEHLAFQWMFERFARLEAAEKERDEWRLALEGLTPQGSEYYNDIKRCVDYVVDRLASDHKRTVEEVKRRVAAEKENAELKDTLAFYADATCAGCLRLTSENAELRAEVERLRGYSSGMGTVLKMIRLHLTCDDAGFERYARFLAEQYGNELFTKAVDKYFDGQFGAVVFPMAGEKP